MYETGPRPSPVRVAKTFCPSNMWNKLIFSIILDAIGSSSYVVPVRHTTTKAPPSPQVTRLKPPSACSCCMSVMQGLGEFTDVAWAPTQAVLMAAMYSESSPYAAYVGMLEEILPFTDIIPSVTLAWYPATTSPSESCCFVALLTRAPAMGCCLCQQATGERWRGGEEPSSHGAADAAVPAAAAVPALPAPGAAPGAAAPGRPDPMSRQAGRQATSSTDTSRQRERGKARREGEGERGAWRCRRGTIHGRRDGTRRQSK